MIYASGDIYEGEWNNGVFCGKGKYKFNNGDYYKGKFKDGLFHGNGEYKYSNLKNKKLMVRHYYYSFLLKKILTLTNIHLIYYLG